MAKRGRPRKVESLDGLFGQLQALDAQRARLAQQIRSATDRLLSGESPFPWRQGGGPKQQDTAGRRRKRPKLSAAARKRISDKLKASWAKRKAGKK